MSWFLQNYEIVLAVLSIGFSFLFGILTFIRTGSVKNSLNVMKEVNESLSKFYGGNELKYKTIESEKPKATEFSPYKDKFILDVSTGELEKLPTPENVQDRIDSFLECALERALERFMPKGVVESEEVAEGYSRCCDDLAGLAEAMEIAEEYRDRYHLSESMSMADIYDFVDEQARELKEKLDTFSKPKEGVKNESEKKKTE